MAHHPEGQQVVFVVQRHRLCSPGRAERGWCTGSSEHLRDGQLGGREAEWQRAGTGRPANPKQPAPWHLSRAQLAVLSAGLAGKAGNLLLTVGNASVHMVHPAVEREGAGGRGLAGRQQS